MEKRSLSQKHITELLDRKDSQGSTQFDIEQKKNRKKQYTKSLKVDHQRLHKIQLQTMQVLNKYLGLIKKENKLQTLQQHVKQINSQKQKKQEFNGKAYNRIRDRFFSLNSCNKEQIHSQLNKVKEIYGQFHQKYSLEKMEHKLYQAKISSKQFDRQLKEYQLETIDKIKYRNWQGCGQWNNGIGKKEWVKRNKTQINKSRAGSNQFFCRQMTTNYQVQRKRIMERIAKLKISTQPNSMPNEDIILFDSSQAKNYNIENKNHPISQYQRQNQFVRKAWKLNNRNQDSFKFRQNIKIIQRKKVVEGKNNEQSLGWGMKFVDMSEFYSQYQNLMRPRIDIKTQKGNDFHRLKLSARNRSLQLLNHNFKHLVQFSSASKQVIATKFGINQPAKPSTLPLSIALTKQPLQKSNSKSRIHKKQSEIKFLLNKQKQKMMGKNQKGTKRKKRRKTKTKLAINNIKDSADNPKYSTDNPELYRTRHLCVQVQSNLSLNGLICASPYYNQCQIQIYVSQLDNRNVQFFIKRSISARYQQINFAIFSFYYYFHQQQLFSCILMGTSISSTKTHSRLLQLRKQKKHLQKNKQKIHIGQQTTIQAHEQQSKKSRDLIKVQINAEHEKDRPEYLKFGQDLQIKIKKQHKIDQLTTRVNQQAFLKQRINQSKTFNMRQNISRQENNLAVLGKPNQLECPQMSIQVLKQQGIPSSAHLKTSKIQIRHRSSIISGKQNQNQRVRRLDKPQNQLSVYKQNEEVKKMRQQDHRDMRDRKNIQEAKDYINNSNFLQPHNQIRYLPANYLRSKQSPIEDFYENKSTDLIKRPYGADDVQNKQAVDVFAIRLKTEEKSIQKLGPYTRNKHKHGDAYTPGQFVYDSSKARLDNSIYMLGKIEKRQNYAPSNTVTPKRSYH